MEAYCLKCKEKREMQDPAAGYTKTGSPMTQGTCPVCGTKLTKLGKTPEHDHLEKPVIEKSAPVKKNTAKKTAAAPKKGTAAAKTKTAKASSAKKAAASAKNTAG